jgi:threonyl-tRNA synthetase
VGTVQLDFQLPRRFDCVYTDADGEQKTPAVIHNAVYGTLERFIGILIEHTAGAFPAWLAPLHARVLPVTDDQRDYAADVLETLRRAGLRAEMDTSGERMAAMIRNAQLDKIPYMLVVGKREAANETVSVRLRSERDLGPMPLDAFLNGARAIIDAKSLELWGA